MTVPTASESNKRPSWYGRLLDAMNGAGSIIICSIMAMVCVDVVARTVFSSPIPGIPDIVAVSIIVLVFLQIGSALRNRRVVRSDMFLDGLLARRPRAGNGLQCLFDLAGAVVFGLIGYASWKPMMRAIEDQEFFGVVGIFTTPIWPMYVAIVFGSALTAIQYLLNAFNNFSLAYRSE